MPIEIPTTCLYCLVLNGIKKVVQQKGHMHFDKTMHDIFSFFFQSQKCVSVITCKVRRAVSIEGSFNKINKFIFYQIMR